MYLQVASGIWRSLGHQVARRIVRRAPEQRRVLFASHNSMMAGYLAEVWEIIKHDPRITCYVTFREPEDFAGDLQRSAELLPLKHVSLRMANVLPWDLVTLANHPGVFDGLARPDRHAVLRIPHGVGSKLVNGVDYQYGDRIFDQRGKLLYTRMLDSSAARKSAAESAQPHLKGRVTVVGSLRLDRLHKARSARTPKKHTQQRVLIASSWGTNHLLEGLRHADFPSWARSCSNRFTFVLRPHPNLRTTRDGNGTDWESLLRSWSTAKNVEVAPPERSLEEDLCEADIVVADDLTSVSLFAAALRIPLALYLTRQPTVGVGTFLDKLGSTVPSTDDVKALRDTLEKATTTWPYPGLDQLASEIDSFPGESETRVRDELYDLLALPPLSTQPPG